MYDEMLAVASQQTLSLFTTEGENFCLDEGRCFSTDNTFYSLHFRASGPCAGGCGLLLGFGDLHEYHWLK